MPKRHAALSAADALDKPHDHFVRDLSAFKICLAFPFLTTVSPLAEASQIRDGSDFFGNTLNAFRRLMYVDRDLERCRLDMAHLRSANGNETARMVGDIFAAIVSPAFPRDR